VFVTANPKKRRVRRCNWDRGGEMSNDMDGGHDGRKIVAHHIGLDNIFLPG
jgi:hypothetical protein